MQQNDYLLVDNDLVQLRTINTSIFDSMQTKMMLIHFSILPIFDNVKPFTLSIVILDYHSTMKKF